LAKDRLFLLPPGFEDQGGTWVCPYCTAVEGYLHLHPGLRDKLEVVYLPFPRPREPLKGLLGDAHQDLPCLVLAEPSDSPDAQAANGVSFIDTEAGIMRYLAAAYGSRPPHP
jgi:hypothetical protein